MQAKLFYGALSAFAVGIGLQTVFDWPIEVVLWLLVLAFGLAVVWRRRGEAPSAPYLLLMSVCLSAGALGLLRTEVASWQFAVSPLADSIDTTVSLEGVIAAEPDYRERMVQFYLQTESDKVLVSTDRLTTLSYGDEVTVTGRLEEPGSFVTDLGREFDYAGYLRARGVEYRVSFAEVAVAGSGRGNPIIAGLLTAKQQFVDSLEQIIPEPAVGLGNGLLLGIQSALGDEIENDFRRTGIIHIVVLSGYNVMLVVAFILFCFSFVFSLRVRVVAAIVAIIAFALIVGLSATVVRASIMASLVLLAQQFGRRYHVLRALFLAGAVMLLLNPYLLLYDIGFQLSFMATLGLILIVPHFESTVVKEGTRLGPAAFFFATLATQIAVLPLLMYHIGEVSLIALLVNVLVLPMVPIAMLLTFITGIVGLVFVPLAALCGYLATLSLEYILLVASWFAAVPFAAVSVPAFPAWGVFLLYGLMGAGWYWWQRRGVSSMRGWEIEEEVDGVAGVTARSAVTPATKEQKDLPIFFR